MIALTNPMTTCDSCGFDHSGLERVRFFPRQLITADDFLTEQQYVRQKQRRHNRFLHGWGTVCGLEVKAAPLEDVPWRVSISPGYALSPQGDEIYVPKPVCIDLAKCGMAMVPDVCEPHIVHPKPLTKDNTIFVGIRYVECPTRPVRVHPLGCGCDDTACEYSRIRDSFDITCLPELPPSHNSLIPSLCSYKSDNELMPCFPCPEEPWVVLAQVSLPDSSEKKPKSPVIDNITFRRQLYSSAVLQEQLIACCCKQEAPQPPLLAADLEITLEEVERVGARSNAPRVKYYIKVENLNESVTSENVTVKVSLSELNLLKVEKAEEFIPAEVWEDTSIEDLSFMANLGSLAPKKSIELYYWLTVSYLGGTSPASLRTTATVDSVTLDPNIDNNVRELTSDLLGIKLA